MQEKADCIQEARCIDPNKKEPSQTIHDRPLEATCILWKEAVGKSCSMLLVLARVAQARTYTSQQSAGEAAMRVMLCFIWRYLAILSHVGKYEKVLFFGWKLVNLRSHALGDLWPLRLAFFSLVFHPLKERGQGHCTSTEKVTGRALIHIIVSWARAPAAHTIPSRLPEPEKVSHAAIVLISKAPLERGWSKPAWSTCMI